MIQPERRVRSVWESRFWAYLIGFGMVVVVTVVCKLLEPVPLFDKFNTALLFVLCVVISATFLGPGPSLLASFLGVLAFDFFFIPPVLTVTVANDRDGITLLILLAVMLAISALSPRIRR